MWGILRKKRLSSLAVVSSLALLVTSIAPCNCLGLDSLDKQTGDKQAEHPCGNHDSTSHSGSDHDHNKTHSHDSKSNCCCSVKSPSALFDTKVLTVAQSKLIPEPKLLPLDSSIWNSSNRFIEQFQIFPRGSPDGGPPFTIFSSSTLSVRLQRWLI